MSPPRPQKRTLFKKVRTAEYCKISHRDNLCLQLQRLAIILQGFLVTIRFYGRQSRKALREELRSDHADELAVFLNSKTIKEIRIAGIKLSVAH